MDYFEFAPMNKQEMIDYLGEAEALEKKIPELLEDALSNVETLEESIQRNSFHHPEMEDGASAPAGSGNDKVYSTLMAVYRDMELQQKEAANDALKYQTAANKLSFVKKCIRKLRADEENIILEIYVKHTPVKVYAVTHNISRSWVDRKINIAMSNLLTLYNKRFESGGYDREENKT